MSNVAPTSFYRTRMGAAYCADSLSFMRDHIPDDSVKLVVTSPPFALHRKKEYGNVDVAHYLDWFMPFAEEIRRILKEDGSFVLDLGGTWNRGRPTRSLYHFEVAVALTRSLFHLAQEFFWYNPSKLPSPAEWVNVRRIRVKDAVNTVWWFSKSEHPDADNRRVLTEYSESMKKLLENGYTAKLRPSGWDISEKFSRDHGGAIPPNLLQLANTESNSQYQRLCREHGVKVHPARFPYGLPEFFVRFLTRPGELVYDCFGGSNVTGRVCEDLGRRWIVTELDRNYLRGSMFRFYGDDESLFTEGDLVADQPARLNGHTRPAPRMCGTFIERLLMIDAKVTLPISERARTYGYVIWPKAMDDAMRGLLRDKDRIETIVAGQSLGEKRVDWKYRRVSIGKKQFETLPADSASLQLEVDDNERLIVSAM